jgi:hypothetical protein
MWDKSNKNKFLLWSIFISYFWKYYVYKNSITYLLDMKYDHYTSNTLRQKFWFSLQENNDNQNNDNNIHWKVENPFSFYVQRSYNWDNYKSCLPIAFSCFAHSFEFCWHMKFKKKKKQHDTSKFKKGNKLVIDNTKMMKSTNTQQNVPYSIFLHYIRLDVWLHHL